MLCYVNPFNVNSNIDFFLVVLFFCAVREGKLNKVKWRCDPFQTSVIPFKLFFFAILLLPHLLCKTFLFFLFLHIFIWVRKEIQIKCCMFFFFGMFYYSLLLLFIVEKKKNSVPLVRYKLCKNRFLFSKGTISFFMSFEWNYVLEKFDNWIFTI